MRLLLLRHGQTHGNVAGALDTAHPGHDLTELGQWQAEAAVPHLAAHAPQAIYASSRARAQQTASPLAAHLGLDVQHLDGSEEIGAGNWEMSTDDDAIGAYISTVAAWIAGDLQVRMSGGESGHEFLRRYDDAIAHIHAQGHDSALLVSHGAAIRTWASLRVDEAELEPHKSALLSNTGLVVVEGDPHQGWGLHSWHSPALGGHRPE